MILAQGFQSFVLDLDGVVWRGAEPVPGSPETIRALRDAGRRFTFMTNNSSQRPDTFAKRLTDIGAGGDATEVLTSALAAGRLLTTRIEGVRGRTAFVIGGPGLIEAVENAGAHLVDGEDATCAAVVVVGLDTGLTYDKLRIATTAIRSGAFFVATNADPTYPGADGPVPGAGSIVAALRATTGRDPMVAGKPEPVMLELAKERMDGGAPLVIGDRISTDIMAARALGWPNALVMSGATGVGELAVADIWPDAILRSLRDLLVDLPHPRIRPATGPDLPPVATLLHDGGLQAGNMRERAGRTVVAETGRDALIATAAWDPAGDAALIRSVAVASPYRGKGAGLAAVAGALRLAARAGMTEAYLATVDAEGFFAACGFERIAREAVPDAVLAHPQIGRECPSTAAVMRLQIPAATS